MTKTTKARTPSLSLGDRALMLLFLDGKPKLYGKKDALGLKIEYRPGDKSRFVLVNQIDEKQKEAIAMAFRTDRNLTKETTKLTPYGQACDKWLEKYGKKLNVDVQRISISQF